MSVTTDNKNQKPPNQKYWNMKRKEGLAGYFFSAPWIIGFCIVFAYPLWFSITLAFNKIVDIRTWKLEFVGFKNFIDMFRNDADFIEMLTQTLWGMLINTLLIVIFALFIAILLNRKLIGKAFFRAAFLLPVLLGTGIVLQALTNNAAQAEIGMAGSSANQFSGSLMEIGVSDWVYEFLGEDIGKIITTILEHLQSVLWMSGIQIIIYLGALQTIPATYYEAAVCDGATEWEKFWKITFPLIMPTVLLIIIYTIIDFMTNINNRVVRYIMEVSFSSFRLEYGSAIGWVYFLIIAAVVGLVFLVMNRFTFYMGEKN